MKTTSKNTNKGAVAVEYLIGLIFIVIILLIPIPSKDGKNALQLLADAIKQEHSSYIKAQSLPPLPLRNE